MRTESPELEHRRWKRELDQSKRREAEWMKQASRLYERYRGGAKKRNSFNLLWSNTETLRPSLYNSVPTPDVRRRFRDADPVGKAVSELLERCLHVALDSEGFETGMKHDVLDSLIVGRGLTRVRYVPSFSQVGVVADEHGRHEERDEEPTHEAHEGDQEELEHEQVGFEHVDWQDFRHGYGRVWSEVPWVGFRAKLSQDEVAERFGEDVAAEVTYDQAREDETKQRDDENTTERVAEFWEIWDREKRRVFFIQEGFPRLIFPLANPNGDPPLTLHTFFPIPEPLRMVEDSSSLLPIPLFALYAEQADEVDRLSARINKIVNALKVRGVYDATLSELSDLMAGEDNDLIPVSKAAAWKESGGFDKAIWWMPIEHAAAALRELYVAREAAKQAIYEITGISDIVRGATRASETFGAQQIKSQFASVRLSRMRDEVSRYIRDVVRLAAEIIAEKFQPETLMAMTGLSFPTAEQKMMMQGDPAVEKLPTIEEILQVLHSDGMRQYRVDIETSSTVASSIESDMTGLRDVLGGLIEFWNGSGPAVQAGALPIEAVKSISLEIVRRARMGLSVEDAIDQIKAPQPQQPQQGPEGAPQQPPELDPSAAIKAQVEAEMGRLKVEQAKAETEAAMAKARAEIEIAQIRVERERARLMAALGAAVPTPAMEVPDADPYPAGV
jgi:hypothetical protein